MPSVCRRHSRRPGGLGDVVRAGRSVRLYDVAAGACLDQCGVSGIRASPQAEAPHGAASDDGGAGDAITEEAWREITVAEGSQGPRSYRFSAQRVRPTSRRKPGEIHWAIYRRNLDGSEPRYYLSNAPEDTPLETLAYVGGSRWRIETEFETEKSDVGLDEYETRTWAGWHHHVALCLLGGAFLLSLQQAWGGKDAPDHEAAGLPGGAGNAAPGNGSDLKSCCGGCRIRRTVTNGPDAPMPSAAPPCGHHPTSLPELTL